MTTSPSVAEASRPPYPVDSPEGQEILRGLFRQAFEAIPPDVLERCCEAITAEDDDAAATTGGAGA